MEQAAKRPRSPDRLGLEMRKGGQEERFFVIKRGSQTGWHSCNNAGKRWREGGVCERGGLVGAVNNSEPRIGSARGKTEFNISKTTILRSKKTYTR